MQLNPYIRFMKTKEIVLSSSPNGNDVKSQTLLNFVNENDKEALIDFLYDRLYYRYIHPFKYSDKTYKNEYKNGFAIMASCCLLIETFTSYKCSEFINTKYKCERVYGWFFLEHEAFKSFAKNGLSKKDYLLKPSIRNNRGMPRDFYINVRCAILHNGETRNKWRILRNGKLFDEVNKSINSVRFLEKIEESLILHLDLLKRSSMDSLVWNTYKLRLEKLLKEI